MSTSPESEDRIEEVLQLWEQQLSKGLTPVLEELCRDCPELLPEIAALTTGVQRTHESIKSRLGSDSTDRDVPPELEITTLLEDLEHHKEGGFADVFRARDSLLGRQLALKILKDEHAWDREHKERFSREVAITSRLPHPGIVTVVGRGDGGESNPCYAMHFIESQTLEEKIDDFHREIPPGTERDFISPHNLEFQELLSHFVSLCETIQFAHSNGIVHRDIKPRNVKAGDHGETIVLDWGLAVALPDSVLPNKEALGAKSGDEFLGTSGYMSPEQLAHVQPSVSDDIFALGATLYRLITGKRPLPLQTKTLPGGEVRVSEPATVSWKNAIPKSLRAITNRAMSLDLTHRYESADALAMEVKNLIADRPIAALPDGIFDNSMRWLRHHRFVAKLSVIALTVVGVLLFILEQHFQQTAADKESLAQFAAASYEESLRTSASSLAQSVEAQLKQRLQVLTRLAKEKELIESVSNSPGDVQDWMMLKFCADDQGDDNQAFLMSSLGNFFILDIRGVQVGRFPPAESLGELYRRRDYFHGLGHDLEADDPRCKSVKPHEKRFHISVPYLSTNKDPVSKKRRRMVTMSVPISDESGELLGVVCNALEPDQVLTNDAAILVAVGTQRSPAAHQRQGLIIDHKDLAESEVDFPRLNVQDTVTACSLVDTLAEKSDSRGIGRLKFMDPLTDSLSDAAMCAVVLYNVDRQPIVTGWIVIQKGAGLPPVATPTLVDSIRSLL